STNVIKLLNAGITFDAISKLVGDQRDLILNKNTDVVLTLLGTKKVTFDALSNLKTSHPQYQLQTILSQSKAVCAYLGQEGNDFNSLSRMNSKDLKNTLNNY
ncbi:MAG: hypothetical protein K2Y01_11260, partial [Rhabdochlamydiaceae bacterium]|nr:hypothetical protein [Rhabdochlamydiaceae bacterium]